MLGALTLAEFLLFLFATISYIFYILLLVLLYQHRNTEPFNAHFFKLFFSVGIADLCSCFFSYALILFKFWGWVNWSSIQRDVVWGWWFNAFGYCASFYFGWSQYLGVINVTINRYYQLVRSAEFWNSKVHLVALLIQWMVPVLFVIPWLTQEYSLIVTNGTGVSYLVAYPHLTFLAVYNLILGFLLPSIINLTAGVLYVRMFSHIRQLVHEHNLEDKADLKLAFLGFVLFILMACIELILISFAISVAIGDYSAQIFFAKLGYQALVVFGLANPWLLVICSQPTRDMIVTKMACNHNTVQPIN